ncbi:MAG: hypothetical protein A2015_00005, partial [Spirochaetes bacterium GWF1_31_7]
MNDIAIKVDNLTKIYKLYKDPVDRLKEALSPYKKKYHTDFFALKNVSFEISKGETVGIIGKNGAGKSTLLKILTGVLIPSSGNAIINGRVSALLELGTGFNPDLTGIENIYFVGTIRGFRKKELDEKLDEILSFADLGQFIYQPVKTYSSGMFVRLAFSLLTSISPEILIVDEALSVGDMFFQAKCKLRMKGMIDNDGTTLLFVSHSMDSVKSLCKKSILLDNGSVTMIGDSSEVAEKYFEMKVSSEQKILKQNDKKSATINYDKEDIKKYVTPSKSFIQKSNFQRIQNGKAEFLNVVLLDEKYNELNLVNFNQTIILRTVLKTYEDIEQLSFGYHIQDKNGISIIYGSAGVEEKRI